MLREIAYVRKVPNGPVEIQPDPPPTGSTPEDIKRLEDEFIRAVGLAQDEILEHLGARDGGLSEGK